MGEAAFESDFPEVFEPLPESDQRLVSGLLAEIQLNLDDMEILIGDLPPEVAENCMEAFREGKLAQECGDTAYAEEMTKYIRGRLLSNGTIK